MTEEEKKKSYQESMEQFQRAVKQIYGEDTTCDDGECTCPDCINNND